jgi:hypothetical protein
MVTQVKIQIQIENNKMGPSHSNQGYESAIKCDLKYSLKSGRNHKMTMILECWRVN